MGKHINVEYKGEKKSFKPEEMSSMVLTKMKEIAEAYLGETVTDAVVTLTKHILMITQRNSTRDACLVAGLSL